MYDILLLVPLHCLSDFYLIELDLPTPSEDSLHIQCPEEFEPIRTLSGLE